MINQDKLITHNEQLASAIGLALAPFTPRQISQENPWGNSVGLSHLNCKL